jgi:hypothetical protein
MTYFRTWTETPAWPEGDKVTTGGKAVVSEDMNFVLLTGVAVIYCLRKGAAGP